MVMTIIYIADGRTKLLRWYFDAITMAASSFSRFHFGFFFACNFLSISVIFMGPEKVISANVK